MPNFKLEDSYKAHLLEKYTYCFRKSATSEEFAEMFEKVLADVDAMGWKIQQGIGGKLEIVDKEVK
jgi:hypothetical protein